MAGFAMLVVSECSGEHMRGLYVTGGRSSVALMCVLKRVQSLLQIFKPELRRSAQVLSWCARQNPLICRIQA